MQMQLLVSLCKQIHYLHIKQCTMRKIFLTTAANSFLILFLFLLTTGCKKDHEPGSNPRLSFTYEGKQYNLPQSDAAGYWAIYNGGLEIRRPDIFGGYIFFPKSGCALFAPVNTEIQLDNNCQYYSSGAIDSTNLYHFESGSLKIHYANCHIETGKDWFTGTPYSIEYCIASGTFDLTLKNKEGKLIIITNGKAEDLKLAP
jgi:hypothetical protein